MLNTSFAVALAAVLLVSVSAPARAQCNLSCPTPQLYIERWAAGSVGFWSSQKWLGGDFNGDGRKDLAYVVNDKGLATIDVLLSDGRTFSAYQRWAIQQGGFWDAQKWLAGDFNGDGLDDVAKVYKDRGNADIDVHLSNGRTFYTVQHWATRQGGFWDAQKWMAGDFNGDGFDDFAKVYNDGGSADIDVHLSDGSRFYTVQHWATRQGGYWDAQKWMAGDFNGDGFDDFAKVYDDAGNADLDVHLSNGSSFYTMQQWATRQGGFWAAQKWMPGDFNGDGLDDFAKIYGDVGGTAGAAVIDVHILPP